MCMKSTKDAVRAICATDPSITPVQVKAALAELDGEGSRHLTNSEPLDRVISRKQAADILGYSKKSVSEKVKAGKIKAIYGGANGNRITGISEQSVRDFMANNTSKAHANE